METLENFLKRLATRLAATAGFTCDPSPRSHVYRLIVLLGVTLYLFVQVKDWMTPDDWNQAEWYRTAAAEELKHLPMSYGPGNEPCFACHAERREQLAGGGHRNLACEGCHGPGPQHANVTDKLAAAVVDPRNELCLACHLKSVARPKTHPKYSEKAHKGMGLDVTKDCKDCHAPHAPKFQTGWGF